MSTKVNFRNDHRANNYVKSVEEIETFIGSSPNQILEYVIIQATLKSFLKSSVKVSTYLPKEKNWDLLNHKQTLNAKIFKRNAYIATMRYILLNALFFKCKKVRKLWEHVENKTQAKFGIFI